MTAPLTVLVVGATGSIGRLVVAEAIGQGYTTRALVRDPSKGRQLPADAQLVVGNVTRPGTLPAAVGGVDAVVLTLGSGKVGAETIDYGGVRNVLAAVGGREVRIALMTSIGVTDRTGAYNRSTQAHDWKRRSERLVRASGHPYTIVRPGWFDYNAPDQQRLTLLQGDTRHAGDSSDGVIARPQIAQVLVASLASDAANRKPSSSSPSMARHLRSSIPCSASSNRTGRGVLTASTTVTTCRRWTSRNAYGTTSKELF